MRVPAELAEDDVSFSGWNSQLKKIRVVSSETDLPLKSCLLAVWRECVVPVMHGDRRRRHLDCTCMPLVSLLDRCRIPARRCFAHGPGGQS